MRNKKNKIVVSALISLLAIGVAITFINSLSAKRSLLLVEKELKEELQKLKEAGIPTTIEELNLPEIPDEENGALVYKEVFKLKDSLKGKYKEIMDYSPHQNMRTRWEEVPEEKKQEVIEFILHNSEFADMYNLLEKASDMECRFSTNEDYKKDIPYDNKVGAGLRDCARDLADKAKIEREYGDTDKALSASLVGLKLSQSLANEPLVIYQLVRFAIDDLALRELEETLNKEGGSLELYQSLIDEIEKERETNIINLALQREFICYALPLFSRYKGLGKKAFELTEEEKKMEKSLVHGVDLVKQIKDRKQTLKNIYLNSGCKTPEEFFVKEEISSIKIKSKLIPSTEKPYWQVSNELKTIDADIESLQGKSLLSNIISSSNQRIYMAEAQYDARLGAAEIAIANKIYKKKYGEYVESLVQLTPEILPTLPPDPFSGKDYIYKKKDKGFIVYSIGNNMKDDNGTKRVYKQDSSAYENYDIVWECGF